MVSKKNALEQRMAELAKLVTDSRYDFTFQVTPKDSTTTYCMVNAQIIEKQENGDLKTLKKVTANQEGSSIIDAQYKALRLALILLGVLQ